MSNPVESLSDSDERRLLEKTQAGDLSAFEPLVLRHQREIFAVALRMLGNDEEAKDVAQETFVRAYRAIKSFRREARLSTWLVSITMNLCRNQRRWWARRHRVIVASLDELTEPEEAEGLRKIQQVADPNPGPLQLVQSQERQRYIAQALQTLDETARGIIVLRDIQGYSYEEIAQMLHTNVGTVKSRLSRARLKLRALLDGKL